ncbi:MAG: helix-hairpin-helix domain-containing protein [Bacteroidota bacterium]
MTNRQVASVFNKLAKVMELHQENPFKIRSYSSAYNTIRRHPDEVIALEHDQLTAIKGIGKNIADKIIELRETGDLQTLQRYLQKTPPGIVEMLSIKGLGAKKILTIWNDLDIQTPGELLYACQENRLLDLKGFGAKTQAAIQAQIEYYLDSKGSYLYGHIEKDAEDLKQLIQNEFVGERCEFGGLLLRKSIIVDGIHLLTTEQEHEIFEWLGELDRVEIIEDDFYFNGAKVIIEQVDREQLEEKMWQDAGSTAFIAEWNQRFGLTPDLNDSKALFENHGLAYIPVESRELEVAIDRASDASFSLVDEGDIKGVLHTHTKWSDGTASVLEMAKESQRLGYEYLLVTDHSQSAFYANGLKPDRVLAQMEEIESIEHELEHFRIFKGIECDILSDGTLDYDDGLLERFDCVIASVHSNLRMPLEKAQERLLKAIEHPATKILGHMTGRLLLSRPGYPVDHRIIIEACAQHGVCIELNANPYRLDMDWTWIPYAMECGVQISINPDAHSLAGIQDIRYGVLAARKGLLTAASCLNHLSASEFEDWCRKK